MTTPTTHESSPVRFIARDVCLEVIAGLEPALALIRRRDASLATQTRRAIDSTLLNLAEGNGREGLDRLHHFRIALGSLREANAALDIAGARRWLPQPLPMAAARDRLGALIFGLIRGRRR
jgi:four helix bundle protein